MEGNGDLKGAAEPQSPRAASFGFIPLVRDPLTWGGLALVMAVALVLGIDAVVASIRATVSFDAHPGHSYIPGSVFIALYHPWRAGVFYAAVGVSVLVALATLYIALTHLTGRRSHIPFSIRRPVVQLAAFGALLAPAIPIAGVLYWTYSNSPWNLLVFGGTDQHAAKHFWDLVGNLAILGGIPLAIAMFSAVRLLRSHQYRMQRDAFYIVPVAIAVIAAIFVSGFLVSPDSRYEGAAQAYGLPPPTYAGHGFTTIGARSTGEPMFVPFMSCIGQRCIAMGDTAGTGFFSALETSSDGGVTWHASRTPALSPHYDFVDSFVCTNVLHCVASVITSKVLVTADGGHHWRIVPLSTGNSISSPKVACTSDEVCAAVANQSVLRLPTIQGEFLMSRDGGYSWVSRYRFSAGTRVWAVTCVTTDTCWVAGYRGDVPGKWQIFIDSTTDGGITWTQQATRSGGGMFSTITCPSVTQCYAYGPAVANYSGSSDTKTPLYVTNDGGRTWTDDSPGPTFSGTVSMACSSASDCLLIGEQNRTAPDTLFPMNFRTATYVTHDAGTTWTELSQSNPGTSFGVAASQFWMSPGGLFCRDALHCTMAVAYMPDQTGRVATTSDGGATWAIHSFGRVAPGIVRDVIFAEPTFAGAYNIQPWSPAITGRTHR